MAIITGMVTKIRKGARGHLYIAEWQAEKGLTDKVLAERLGIARNSVWRWKDEQHRLTPGKIKQLADALGILPAQLWGPPQKLSLDALVADAPEDLRQKAAEMVTILVRTGT